MTTTTSEAAQACHFCGTALVEDHPLEWQGRVVAACAWCDHTNKQTFSDESLRKLYTQNYELVYVDAESGRRLTLPNGERITEAELGVRLKAFATPLFVYFTPQGERIVQIPGFKTVKDFRDYDRYVREGHYKNKTLLEFLGDKS
jgi:thioredoxin-related protein